VSRKLALSLCWSRSKSNVGRRECDSLTSYARLID